jgi:prephenate dehydratase
MKKVFYQGTKGCFSELAAVKFFGKSINKIGVTRFEDIFKKVNSEKGTYGIIPVENSLTGSIHKNFDLLIKNNIWVIGEVKLRIIHNLLVHPYSDASLKSINEVWSHPEALAQCNRFLSLHPEYKIVSVYDTAGAAKIANKEKRYDVGVIAGPQVANFYGFKTLKENIEDNPQNYTRFLIISREKKIYADKNVRTMLVFGVKNEPGILFRCLSVFALRNIDLTKLESRPIVGKPWEYIFYIDFKGSIEDDNCKQAVDTLREFVDYLKFLGSYTVKE